MPLSDGTPVVLITVMRGRKRLARAASRSVSLSDPCFSVHDERGTAVAEIIEDLFEPCELAAPAEQSFALSGFTDGHAGPSLSGQSMDQKRLWRCRPSVIAIPPERKRNGMNTDANAPDTIGLIHGFWVTPRSWEHWITHYESKGYRVSRPPTRASRSRSRRSTPTRRRSRR
jgi:hypothetical protein